MYIRITQHYCIMQKMSGKICDSCRTMFYPGDHIVELCLDCAHKVWCVTNVYEDGSKELSSIHRAEYRAKEWVEKSRSVLDKVNPDQEKKIVKQEINCWYVL